MNKTKIDAELQRLRNLLKTIIGSPSSAEIPDKERGDWLFSTSEKIQTLKKYQKGEIDKPNWWGE